MMNEFFGTSPWTAITKDVARKRRGPIVAAVSYVGSKAGDVLPLRKGDFLVCDASERAIRQGVTSAKALGAYLRVGVKVFSYEGLHAKVVASETFAWVGSANASENSRDHLTEASVRLEGPAGRKAYKWAESLAAEDIELSKHDVQRLAKLPVSWQVRGGELERKSNPVQMPRELSRLVILELNYGVSTVAEKAAEKHRVEVKKSLSVQSSQLNWFENRKPLPVKEGQWFIPIYGNKVGKPCRLERVKKETRFDICWYAQIRTTNRLKATVLRNLVSGVDSNFDYRVLTDQRQIAEILNQYGAVKA
jgi:hypothetical protein